MPEIIVGHWKIRQFSINTSILRSIIQISICWDGIQPFIRQIIDNTKILRKQPVITKLNMLHISTNKKLSTFLVFSLLPLRVSSIQPHYVDTLNLWLSVIRYVHMNVTWSDRKHYCCSIEIQTPMQKSTLESRGKWSSG